MDALSVLLLVWLVATQCFGANETSMVEKVGSMEAEVASAIGAFRQGADPSVLEKRGVEAVIQGALDRRVWQSPTAVNAVLRCAADLWVEAFSARPYSDWPLDLSDSDAAKAVQRRKPPLWAAGDPEQEELGRKALLDAWMRRTCGMIEDELASFYDGLHGNSEDGTHVEEFLGKMRAAWRDRPGFEVFSRRAVESIVERSPKLRKKRLETIDKKPFGSGAGSGGVGTNGAGAGQALCD